MERLASTGIAILLACVTWPAYSIDCDQAGTTLEINQCAYADQQATEARLNATYQRVLKPLLDRGKADPKWPDAGQSLILAQRQWIAFRKADCDAVFDFWAQGTIRTLQRLSCMQDHAELRIRQLERYEEQH